MLKTDSQTVELRTLKENIDIINIYIFLFLFPEIGSKNDTSLLSFLQIYSVSSHESW